MNGDRRRCGSCLRWMAADAVRTFVGDDGEEHTFCVDREACERRWEAVKGAERMAAAEARIYDPEPGDER